MSDVTGRISTAIADRYRLERELGQGGMATVFLAHDLKHERPVALKVLRPELAAMIGAERFLNEIRVTANLQHPHILPLHDSGEADTFLFYVMPYVEGDTLRDKLQREKQLDIREAVEITRAIASALDYAHRKGVIHRDIKPENILLHDGQALVADFGIALAISAAGGSRLTETGLSIGTPHYMSPEQAMGDRQLDARSDIYSLGAMLYEMLTGDPPYTGSTAQAIVAKVITEKAPMVTIARDTVPGHVAAAIHKALAKLPADRFHSAADFAEALVRPGMVPMPGAEAAAAAAAGAPRRRLDWRAAGLAAALVASVGFSAWLATRPKPPGQVARFILTLPASQDLNPRFGTSLALSAAGDQIVYIGNGPGGSPQLWLRPIDRLDGTLIPGTNDPLQPFLSPDGRAVAFVTPAGLRVVPLTGGPPVTIADTAFPLGGSWGPNGRIYFVKGSGSSFLSSVAETGGPVERVTTLDSARGERGHRWPDALPGGRGALFTIWRGDRESADIGVVDFRTGAHKVLLRGVYARYLTLGRILFVRSDGAVLAAPFDERTLELTGPAVPLFEGVVVKEEGASEIAVSRSGALLYLAGSEPTEQLVWVGRDGREQPVDTALRYNFETLALSPDGRRIAVSYVADGNQDVWIYDIAARTSSRLTFDPALDYRPVWEPGGRMVTFMSGRGDERALYRKPADGSAPETLLFGRRGMPIQEASWSPDGRFLAFRQGPGTATGRDIGYVEIGRDTTPTMLLESRFDEYAPRLSPDGRWLAYVSNESGRPEVYVRPFPGPGGRWQISTEGGGEPLWAHSGRELFYRDGRNTLVSAQVQTAPAFVVGTRRSLFAIRNYDFDVNYTAYDVTRDDQRFLFIRQAGGTREMVVVLNWFDELRRGPGR